LLECGANEIVTLKINQKASYMKKFNLPILALFVFGSLVMVLGFTRLAIAQSDPCEPDREKFCPMYRADDPRRLYCLKGVSSQLKPSCKATLRNVVGSEEEFIDECTEDYKKFCSEVSPGKGRILKCLKSNSKKLEFECRKKVGIFPEPR
jgi:hypothetical protein